MQITDKITLTNEDNMEYKNYIQKSIIVSDEGVKSEVYQMDCLEALVKK